MNAIVRACVRPLRARVCGGVPAPHPSSAHPEMDDDGWVIHSILGVRAYIHMYTVYTYNLYYCTI